MVTGLEPMRKIGNDAVEQDTIGLHDEHAGGLAWARRAQSDAGSWKFEVEEVGAHGETGIAGIDPAIHLLRKRRLMDTRVKPAYDDFGVHAASAAMRALTILSGFCTGSPRLILSTFSMPDVTLPQTVYWLLRNEASSKQMKNWLSAESGLAARAIQAGPRHFRPLFELA